MRSTLGVVLAGGRGRRLEAGFPKALARVGGSSLLERAVRALEQTCDEVVVTAPPGCRLPVEPARRVEDIAGAEGPLSGLVAGLEARPHGRALVLGVDFPLIRPGALRFLLDRLSDHAAVLPAPGGIPQPLVAAYGEAAGPALSRRLRAGERSVTAAALSLKPLLLDDDELVQLEGGLQSLLNLNTAADLERAERILAARDRSGGAV